MLQNAYLVFHFAIDIVTSYLQDARFDPTHVCLGLTDSCYLPALTVCIFSVDVDQLTSPYASFIASCSGSNFQHNISIIVWISRKKQHHQFVF